MSAIVSNDKFGATILRLAKERAETPEGAAELKGFSKDQFLEVLEKLTTVIDTIPPDYSIHSLFIALNYLGAMVVQIMEANKRRLEKEVGGSA